MNSHQSLSKALKNNNNIIEQNETENNKKKTDNHRTFKCQECDKC